MATETRKVRVTRLAGRRKLHVGEFTLMKNSAGDWRVWRDHHAYGWLIADRRSLLGVLVAGWRNRRHDPNPHSPTYCEPAVHRSTRAQVKEYRESGQTKGYRQSGGAS